MIGQAWTKAELEKLRAIYGTMPVAEVAARLGRTCSATSQAARIEGLTISSHQMSGQELLRLVELAEAGWCNRCIGRSLGYNRGAIRRWRRRLGLELDVCGQLDSCLACKERTRAATKEQCRKAGVRCLAELKAIVVAKFAIEHGWPAHVPPRCVQLLEILAVNGPMTRRMLWEAMGFRWIRSRKAFKGTKGLLGGTYMTHVMHLGLVVSLGRPVRSKPVRQGANVGLYSLTQMAIDMHKEHHERKQRDAGEHPQQHAVAG